MQDAENRRESKDEVIENGQQNEEAPEEEEDEEEQEDNLQSSETEEGDFSLPNEDESFLPEEEHYYDIDDLESRSSRESSITAETWRERAHDVLLTACALTCDCGQCSSFLL